MNIFHATLKKITSRVNTFLHRPIPNLHNYATSTTYKNIIYVYPIWWLSFDENKPNCKQFTINAFSKFITRQYVKHVIYSIKCAFLVKLHINLEMRTMQTHNHIRNLHKSQISQNVCDRVYSVKNKIKYNHTLQWFCVEVALSGPHGKNGQWWLHIDHLSQQILYMKFLKLPFQLLYLPVFTS